MNQYTSKEYMQEIQLGIEWAKGCEWPKSTRIYTALTDMLDRNITHNKAIHRLYLVGFFVWVCLMLSGAWGLRRIFNR